MSDLIEQLEPQRRVVSLTQHAYEQIKRALISGSFRPGQKLTVRSVAAALDISQTPAREAIGRLVVEGGLDSTSTRSFVVPTITREDLEEIYDLRILLEGRAADHAAARFDHHELASLEACQKALIAARVEGDVKEVLKLNEVFHFAIYRASGKPLLVAIIEGLWLRMGPVLNRLYPGFSYQTETLAFHADALQAIKDKDGKALKAAIRSDLKSGYAFLSQSFNDGTLE
ncbi:MAG: GntR family transcriptional regulator [Rhodospirillales bacterium]